MTFDFDTPVNRRGTDSTKWNIPDNELPMWVADMDFRTAPAVERAILGRAEHGVFGYTEFPSAWYDAYIGWWRERHGFGIDRSWLRFASGVIPAISASIRALTAEGERVAVLSPNYNAFFALIENNRRVTAEIPMILGRDPDGRLSYSLDWDLMERTFAEPDVKLFIFCNPQNPTGKIWERETMAKIGALCSQYGVTVLSDEIHSDIAAPGKRVTPFASVNDVNLNITATFLAPTKAFNLMGLHTSAVCAANPEMRKKICDSLGDLSNPNAFACLAAIAAFTEGGEWLDQMNAYVRKNKDRAEEFLRSELPELEAIPSEATYLMWIHTGAAADDSERFYADLRRETGLYVCPGTWYRGDGKRFIRFNAACPRVYLEDGLARLRAGVRGVPCK